MHMIENDGAQGRSAGCHDHGVDFVQDFRLAAATVAQSGVTFQPDFLTTDPAPKIGSHI
jgi:hypothetical protein